jgi:hypothetical protein
MDPITEMKEREIFFKVPFINDRSHHSAHKHLAFLPVGITLPVEPPKGVVRDSNICGPFNQTFVIQVRSAWHQVFRSDEIRLSKALTRAWKGRSALISFFRVNLPRDLSMR